MNELDWTTICRGQRQNAIANIYIYTTQKFLFVLTSFSQLELRVSMAIGLFGALLPVPGGIT